MFTLEESALLRRMLRVTAWLVLSLVLVGGWYGVAHWIHRHHLAVVTSPHA